MGISSQVQSTAGRELEAGIGAHLHEVIAVEQSAGHQLFVAQTFAVAHLGRQVAVGGWGDL